MLRLLLLPLLLLLTAATPPLNMTPKEQKETGLSKLDEKEQKALKAWINAHYTPKDKSLAANQPDRPVLQENLNNGHMIRLSDGSSWEIRPKDTPITQGWITEVEIMQTQSNDAQYPVKLTNSLTGSSVYARKATPPPAKTPPASPPAKKS